MAAPISAAPHSFSLMAIRSLSPFARKGLGPSKLAFVGIRSALGRLDNVQAISRPPATPLHPSQFPRNLQTATTAASRRFIAA
jgi:hypothetical protein